jgi:hypothetical protein
LSRMGIVNEILYSTIGKTPVQSFYYAAYQAIRKSTWGSILASVICFRSDTICNRGIGAGPYIAIHEGFQGVIAAFVLEVSVLINDPHYPSF